MSDQLQKLFDGLDRAGREKLLVYLLEKKQVVDKNRLDFYKPNPGFQEKFFKSKAKVRLVTVGNQAGKSHSGAVEAALIALGKHPHKSIVTPNTGVIVSGQGFKDGIEKVIMPKLNSVVGSNDIRHIKNNTMGIPTKITWRNGSVTHLMSAEQDDKAFEGSTIHYCWIDEPVRRSIFISLKRGFLTTGGILWMTCTPLDEPWIYEDLYVVGKEGKDPEIEVFEGSSDENIHISEKEKNEFKKHLTEDEIDVRWFGKFRHLAGRVFKAFAPDRHVVPSFDIPSHWPVWSAIDPHRNKPWAVIFLAVSPQNIFYVCNEIYQKGEIEDLAESILSIGGQYNLVQRLIDTSAQEDGWENISCRELLQNKGVKTKLAQKKNLKASGIVLINQLFQNDQLLIMEHCSRTIRELRNQVYKKGKDRILEEPEKKFDEMTDCIRYCLNERPTYRGLPRVKELGYALYGRD